MDAELTVNPSGPDEHRDDEDRKRTDHESTRTSQDFAFQAPSESSSDPTQRPERIQQIAAVFSAIERLPQPYRTAIEMRSFERRTFAELAARLDCSIDAARRIWLDAIVRLKYEQAGAKPSTSDG